MTRDKKPDDMFAESYPRFATVAVNQPVDRAYQYGIPATMAPQPEVGSIVSVPFAGRHTAGCVTQINTVPEDGLDPRKIKAISKVITPEFKVPPNLVALAAWISEYYMAPPGETLAAISFMGFNEIGEKTQTLFSVTDKEGSLADGVRLTGKQRAVIEWLLANENAPTTAETIVEETGSTRAVITGLVKRGILGREFKTSSRPDDYDQTPPRDSPIAFNPAQHLAYEEIERSMDERKPRTFLLHGVTGSGKTEVYLQAIQKALNEGGSAVVLVPEIALTPQTVARFRSRFGDAVGVYHSKLTLGQKFDLWRRVQTGSCRIMVGARSAVFTPFDNLRIIVIDEEHETSYKQDTTPRYHARDVAIKRAQDDKAVVILGSATPSVETYFKAQRGKFRLLSLPDRIDQHEMPPIRIVDMTHEAKDNQNVDMFSSPLLAAMQLALDRGEQTLLFLNRRGFFNFAICMDCNKAIHCQHCDVTVTLHRPRNMLICHYCGREYVIPKRCPECDSAELSMIGLGTQRVEERVKELFPEARVIRMDLDTTRKRTAFIDAWKRIEGGDVDIILGTQMIAKGFHLEQVTVVGVPLADVSLFQPDFRSAERAFSVLTQVAGRAGRGEKPGIVIIQTYVPHHYAISFAQTHDYRGFYDKEIRIREVLRFPPHHRLIAVHATGADEALTAERIKDLGRELRSLAYHSQDSITIIGPVPAPIARINDQYRWQVLLRGAEPSQMRQLLRRAMAAIADKPGKSKVHLAIDVDPQDLL